MKHLSVKVDANGTTDEVEVQKALTADNAENATNAINADAATYASNAANDSEGNYIAGYYAPKQSADGGFLAGGAVDTGDWAYGIGLGLNADPSGSGAVAIGNLSQATQTVSFAVFGKATGLSGTIAVGVQTEASGSAAVAIGAKAKASGENSVQIGDGTNSTANTLQFRSYQLLDANGNIPSQRLLSLYPIGSYYITESETTPASLLGGSWVRVTNKFLYGATAQSNVGTEGGEATHTLTYTEMPVHSHRLNYNSTYMPGTNDCWTNAPGANGDGNLKIVADDEVYTSNEGDGTPHNNIPPYRTVNIWRRTA